MNETRVIVYFQNALRIQHVPGPEVRGILTLKLGQYTISGENMSSTMSSGQTAHASIAWVDKNNNPAPVDGVTAWATSDQSVLSVTVDPSDDTKATVSAVGPIGAAQVQATADADMGAGIQSITAVLDITVIAGMAVGGVITLGTPSK